MLKAVIISGKCVTAEQSRVNMSTLCLQPRWAEMLGLAEQLRELKTNMSKFWMVSTAWNANINIVKMFFYTLM